MLPLLLNFFLFFQISHSSPSYHSDEHALLDFRHSLSLDPHNSLHNWSPNHTFCNWTGVACSSRRQRVVSLNLTDMGLVGPISPLVGNLSFLRALDLKNNTFQGSIPDQLGRLFRLRKLRLLRNKLEGSIPSALGGCRSLQYISLRSNNISGRIPFEFGLLSHLKTIAFGINQLTGTIPTSLGNLSSLTILDLSENLLHGSIPDELGMLSQVEGLYLVDNNFTGPIPTALSNCTHLQNLSLGHNHLTGHIPWQIGKLSELKRLYLWGNQVTGEIPSSLSNCTLLQLLELSMNQLSSTVPFEFGKLLNLQELHLWRNQLTGEIPSSLSNCTQLRTLGLSNNQLNGTVPLEFGKLFQLKRLYLWNNHLVSGSSGLSILTALTNCSYLEEMDLSLNYLTGVLPSSVGRLSRALSFFSFDSNELEGNVPDEIANLTKLATLSLLDNRFNGTIPSAVSRLPNLERLFLDKNHFHGSIPKSLGQVNMLGLLSLSENRLSGQIPDSLGDLPQLRRLFLHHNRLSGRIPASLGRCRTLELVDLAYNKLTGNIPPEVAGLQNLAFYFNVSNNLLKGSLLEMSKMVMVQAIDVSVNHFSTGIPSALASCVALEYLNLSWNALQGSIPASLAKLQNLHYMDLSCNNLSGTIPLVFKEMKMLQHLNLSSNRLIGEVPQEGVFATLDASEIMGNLGLCGAWINLPPCSHSKHKQLLASKKVIIPVAAGIAIFIMFLLFAFFYRWKHTSQDIPTLKVGPIRISYEELVDATDGFSEANLLDVGSFGSVYKGILHNGTNIAVKVLNLQDENARRNFSRECNALKRVRHRNVIKKFSVYSNFDFKALVLPFMSNGSLEKWLYPHGGDECKLNLSDRLRIATDVAQGMAYLHHHCFVQVIHCDLKPNNVLLGDDMTSYIADFGIAKLIFGNSIDSLTSTNALKGSIGYIAPEYGMGGIFSTKGDVYSYGILLLELLTRRRPTNDIFVEGISLQKWVGIDFPNKIIDVVDNNLLRDANESDISVVLACLTQFLQVGLACTRELPQQRPDMPEIVQRLEKIRGTFLGTPRAFQLPIDILPLIENTRGARNTNSGDHKSSSTSTS